MGASTRRITAGVGGVRRLPDAGASRSTAKVARTVGISKALMDRWSGRWSWVLRAAGHCPDDRITDRAWECGLPDGAARIACSGCSLRAGDWAGEWEGVFTTQCSVAAPCGVLTQLAGHYGVLTGGLRRSDETG